MLNILSVLTGLVALIFVLPGLVPFFGWANWLALPIVAVGLVLGVLSSSNTGRNVNIVVGVIAVLRLMMGGGFF